MIPIIILTIENEDDREFMSELYCDFSKLIFSKVYSIVKNREAAEDIVQETVIKLIDKVELLKTLDRRRLASYIIETGRNTAIDYLRSNGVKYGLL